MAKGKGTPELKGHSPSPAALLFEALITYRGSLFDLSVGKILAVPEGYAVQRYSIVVLPMLPLQASKLRGLALLEVDVPHLDEFIEEGELRSQVQDLTVIVGVASFERRLDMYRAGKGYKKAALAGRYVEQLPSGLIIAMGKS